MNIEKRRRNTPQRMVILEELGALKTHPTAAELFAIVRRRLPRISLGTVYRNLEVLHEDGQILKLESAGTEARFDATTHDHHHIRCTRCGAVRDVEVALEENPLERIRNDGGFRIESCEVRFFGICPDCQESRPGREPGPHPMH